MTGTRRPTGIPPPSPNHENNSDEGENSEEEEDLDEEGSDGGGSAASGATTPLTREIRSYEERNRELAGRLREVEEERLHQIEIQEGWRNAVIVLESKLSDLRAMVEGVERNGATVGRDVGFTTQDLETIGGIEREVEHLRMLISANERYEAEPDQRPEANDGEGSTWRQLIKRMTPKQMQIN